MDSSAQRVGNSGRTQDVCCPFPWHICPLSPLSPRETTTLQSNSINLLQAVFPSPLQLKAYMWWEWAKARRALAALLQPPLGSTLHHMLLLPPNCFVSVSLPTCLFLLVCPAQFLPWKWWWFPCSSSPSRPLSLLMPPGHLPLLGPAGVAWVCLPCSTGSLWDRVPGAAVTEKDLFPLKSRYVQGKYSDCRCVSPITKQWISIY